MSDLCRTDNSDFTLNEKNKAGLSALHLYSQYLGGRDGGYLWVWGQPNNSSRPTRASWLRLLLKIKTCVLRNKQTEKT